MDSTNDAGLVLVTGARGHIGKAVCQLFGASGIKVLPTDTGRPTPNFVICDVARPDHLRKVLQSNSIRTVIHLAGILPTAFIADPLEGAKVNLTGSFFLLREAVPCQVHRFIYASSMSVYGTADTPYALNEDHPTAPDHPYGAGKRAVELVGETLHRKGSIRFVALRIARVVGPGIKKSSSRWRSEMFEAAPSGKPLSLPFGPDARLSLVHVEDLASMFLILASATEVRRCIYNTPVETWRAEDLKEAIEKTRGIPVELSRNGAGGGPLCDGNRFAQEFGFALRGIRDRLLDCTKSAAPKDHNRRKVQNREDAKNWHAH